ncbi:unnamed protein product [Arabis nemorensis]|uniref:Uncharacterized protein n=1 Tax=Arabis nemorensis TaxID=586526 RepID=A0A565ASN5_9BRAS|nr:unnamed protein product [Arabis nemorensis]
MTTSRVTKKLIQQWCQEVGLEASYDGESKVEEEGEPKHVNSTIQTELWEHPTDDEDEKTSYAEDTLTEDAFRKWEQDAYARLEYDVADASWEEMKQILRKEFVEDADGESNIKIYTNPEPRRWILAIRPNPKAKEKKALMSRAKDSVLKNYRGEDKG